MGSIKKFRKTYQTPSHPWQKERIIEEKGYLKKYGLKNKKEVWKMNSKLTRFKTLAKQYISTSSEQSQKESELLLTKLKACGLLGKSALLNDVLTLTPEDIMERRLQTVLTRKGLARTVSQARQYIVHGHIALNGTALSSPAYIVKKSEEDLITFVDRSSLKDEAHPERALPPKKEKPELTEEEKKARSYDSKNRNSRTNRNRGERRT